MSSLKKASQFGQFFKKGSSKSSSKSKDVEDVSQEKSQDNGDIQKSDSNSADNHLRNIDEELAGTEAGKPLGSKQGNEDDDAKITQDESDGSNFYNLNVPRSRNWDQIC